MIIGNGQLSKIFQSTLHNECVIFASGIANSKCEDPQEFKRERDLLTDTLAKYKDKKIIYFSSCALSAKDYKLNAYYKHKHAMEELIKKESKNYYIFRLPQLFGDLKEHPTLINFLFNSIKNQVEFTLYNDAYRYLIDIDDVKKLVEEYINTKSCITIDLANSYRYSLFEIVSIFEALLKKKAKYKFQSRSDKYELNLEVLIAFIDKHQLDINFGKDYFISKIKNKIS